jgi:4a-hydroxytetrahydrobiopterin dehydratase
MAKAALKALSKAEIDRRVPSLDSWSHSRGALRRTFNFTGFAEALRFVVAVGGLAESANHHPDIDIRYSRVRLALSTHDVSGISPKDFALASRIDSVAARRKRV